MSMYKCILAAILLFPCSLPVVASSTQSLYRKAIIRTALHHIPPSPPQALLDIPLDQPTIRMVSFTKNPRYTLSDTKLTETVWMSVEPELRALCASYVAHKPDLTPKRLAIWLAQRLGLPAAQADQARFVVFDVPVIQAYYGDFPKDIGIFRPCADPRISAHEDNSPDCPTYMRPDDSHIASEYKTWFINYSIRTYRLTREAEHTLGFPWTANGYTYNWNPRAKNIYGVSEFVVLKNTPVAVVPNPNDPSTAYLSPEQYCR